MVEEIVIDCPDLRPYFRHAISRPMPHSMGVPVLSDWSDKADDDPVFGIFKRCGFWTRDEAAILYQVARQIGWHWLDIGSHTGWTASHIAEAGCKVDMLEPMFGDDYFFQRMLENVSAATTHPEKLFFYDECSDYFFSHLDINEVEYGGVVVDGDHDRPHPLHDAQNAAKFLRPTGAIMLHDAIGGPVQEAVKWLMDAGFNLRTYLTPHVVACCWRGDFDPPVYEPDPHVKSSLIARLPDWMLACA